MIQLRASNGFEAAGRLAKVLALVEQLDHLCRNHKRHADRLDPVADGELLAKLVEAAPPELRERIARAAGVIRSKPPSETTWACVCSYLRDRARRAA